MPLPLRRARRAFLWRSALPWPSFARTTCCTQLRIILLALMFLTVVCVALQYLGVVRQNTNDSPVRLDGEQLDQLSVDTHRLEWQDWERLRSVPATVVEDPKDGRAHGQREDKREGLKALKAWDQSVKVSNWYPKTPLPKRLPSTAKKITTVGRAHTAAKTALTEGTMGKPQSDLEVLQRVTNEQKGRQGYQKTTADKVEPTKSPRTLQFLADGINSDPVKAALDLNQRSATCRPKNHVVFLKTHKTASSTILNILYRYGDSRNLTFALPVNKHSQLFYPTFFMAHYVEGVRSHNVPEFHIMCNHMRFRGEEVRKVMPNDTFYFSILRNPVSMMESIFVYYKSIPAFHGIKSLNDFLMQGGRSYNASAPNNHYALNLLTFDFGHNNSAPVNDTELDRRSAEVIASVESHFHLILISEYFDESMVLLRHALCWTIEDVVSFRLNSRNEKSRQPLTPETVEKVKVWNSLDWRIYQHFNASFWHRVDTTLGRRRLQEEVELLRARREELQQTCLLGGAVDPGQIRDMSLKPFQYGAAVIQGYNLRPGLDKATHQLCQNLITPELQYTSALYVKQFPELAAKLKAARKQNVVKRAITTQMKNIANDTAKRSNPQTSIQIAVKRNVDTQTNAGILSTAKHFTDKQVNTNRNDEVRQQSTDIQTNSKQSAQAKSIVTNHFLNSPYAAQINNALKKSLMTKHEEVEQNNGVNMAIEKVTNTQTNPEHDPVAGIESKPKQPVLVRPNHTRLP